MTDQPLWAAEFTRLSDAIRSGAVTSCELTELMLERIAAHDARLNSYAAVAPDVARACGVLTP